MPVSNAGERYRGETAATHIGNRCRYDYRRY